MRIRTQLTASHLIIAILILLVTLLLMNNMVRSHLITEAHGRLIHQGETLASIMATEILFRGLRAPALPDEKLQTIARTAGAMMQGDFVVLSVAGETVISSNRLDLPADPQERLNLEPIKRALEEGEVVSDRSRGPEGERLLTAFVPITLHEDRPPDGLLITFQPEAEALAGLHAIQRITLQVGGVALAMGVLLSLVLARTLSTPVEDLSNVARALRRGDLRQRAPNLQTREFSQMAQTINQVGERLSHSLQRRRAFIASISHEIRTPVTSIRGFVQALRDEVISEEDRNQYLETILGETRRIQRLLEDLLQLERLETGQLSMQFDWVHVDELLERAASRVAHAARQRHIDMRIDLPPEGTIQIWADAERLDQVLGNLTENALRFTPPGGTIELGMRLSEGDPDSEDAVFWVADNGPGVPEEEIDAIFETFHQAADSAPEGAGLGLAICREIVGSHRGAIWMQNRESGGALIQFTIPHARRIEEGHQWAHQ